MALGADDEQSSGGANLLRLLRDGGLVLFQQLLVGMAYLQDFRVVGFGVGVGLLQKRLREIHPGKLRLCQEIGVAAQHDVGTAACHIGGDGHGAQLARLGYDLGFLLMVLGVQDAVGDALPLQKLTQDFALFNGNGTHQHWLTLFVARFHLPDDGAELARFGLVHHVRVVDADDGTVGGNLHHVQIVDGAEFLFLRQGGAGHAGELAVQPEEILEGDGGKGLALPGDGHALLGLDGLVQTLVVPAAVHETAGELVHDDDLTVLDDVVDVPLHKAASLHGLVDVVREGGVLRVGQILHAEELLRLGNAAGGEGHGALLFVHDVVAVVVVVDLLLVGLGEDLPAQGGHEVVGHFVQLGGILPLAGDNQGGTGFINQDGVHLIHDGEGVSPLHQLGLVDRHVVPEVVKAQLVVGAVGDVGGVGHPALRRGHAGNHQTDGKPHVAVDLAHPLRVALGQVFVDGDHVNALAGQRV